MRDFLPLIAGLIVFVALWALLRGAQWVGDHARAWRASDLDEWRSPRDGGR